MTLPDHLNKSPNPWEMRHTDAGRLITLSSALLGITAAFAQDFVEGSARLVLVAGWLSLIFAIVFSIIASGKSISGSLSDSDITNGEPAASHLNRAFWALLIGAVLIAAAGSWSLWSPTLDVVDLIESSSQSLSESMGVADSDLILQKATRMESGGFELRFTNAVSQQNFVVTVDESGEVQNMERTDN